MNKEPKQLDKVTASIEDDELIFTLSGFLDKRDWDIDINFKKFPQFNKGWKLTGLYLVDEDEIRETLRNEYIDYIMEYVNTSVEIEQVDCEHDDEDVFPNEDDVNECDRCGATLGN